MPTPSRTSLSDTQFSTLTSAGNNDPEGPEKYNNTEVTGMPTSTVTSNSVQNQQTIEEKILLSSKNFAKLAQHINKNWELLGLQLGLHQSDIYNINEEQKSLELRIYHMFEKWNQIEDQSAYLHTLQRAIKECPKVGYEQPELKNAILKITQEYKSQLPASIALVGDEIQTALNPADFKDKEQHGVEDLENSKGKKRKSENDRRTEKKIKRQENNVDICFGGDDNDCHDSNDNNNDNNYASIALVGDEIQTALNPADFKEDLKQWYRKNLVSLPLSVTDDTIDTTLESLYVKQELSERTTGKLKKIESLEDLFTPNDKVALEIFLCSIVGAGNTTFAKYLTNLWCQSDLCDIDFVFLLNLTDSLDECNTEDMIYQQIIQNLPCEPSFKGNKSLLIEILKSNRCLIILDESDRWRHPSNGCTKPLKEIPHRFASDNIIVLTIARQRKLIRMKNTQIDKVIVINCLGNESKKQLQINALKGITEIQEKREIVDENLLLSQQQEFQNDISRLNLHGLVSVPLILMHLVCLWWDGELKRMSKCQVYDSIIVMLLSRTLKYFQSSDLNQQQKSGFTEILEGLRKLASNSPRESETIARSLVNRYLNEEQAKLCLLSGIFSESNGKLCSEENSLEIFFTFENVREHFMQVRV